MSNENSENNFEHIFLELLESGELKKYLDMIAQRRNSDTLASFIYQIIDNCDNLELPPHIYNKEIGFMEELYFDQKDISKENIYKILDVLDKFFDKNEKYLSEKKKIEEDFEEWKFIWKTKQYYKELYECRNKYFNHIEKIDENIKNYFERIVEIYDDSIRNCQNIDDNEEYIKIIKVLLKQKEKDMSEENKKEFAKYLV